MYVCGPTVNDLPHLGHGRFSLVWDVLRRWLVFEGLEVHYVSNITDVDDKIIIRARDEHATEPEVAEKFETEWWNAMGGLGVASPTESPHATGYVAQMVEFIGRLLDAGVAYATSDGVYFDVSSVPDYGCVSGQTIGQLRAGERVEPNEEKRSPLDFAVWKKAKPDEPSWHAPFGDGRPGWHTECVVMSLGLLGDDFDLHAGGLDLKFPHHENERAQAIALGYRFSRRWAHNGWVMSGNEKMSKSLKNFTSLTDLLATTDQRAYRLLILRSHYRAPIDVTPTTIADAERALSRLDTLARRFELSGVLDGDFVLSSRFEWPDAAQVLRQEVTDRLEDDLDTPGAVALLFTAANQANLAADDGRSEEASLLARAVAVLFGALGLPLRGSVTTLDEATQNLVDERDDARSAKDWARADELRDALVDRGWVVEDGPTGTVVRR
jgi:cysteinyl-tRNA synthetase